jgi:hypothetical protein
MMPLLENILMRTTLTIDDDIAAKLKSKVKKSKDKSFKEVVNETLRLGLMAEQETPIKPFKIKARNLGAHPGLNFDKISELLEQIEGPFYK